MNHWSDTAFARENVQTLLFAIHDVPFVVRSNDAEVIAHVARLVRRYSSTEPQSATGVQQVLVAVQGTPALDANRLKDVPRRGANKQPRVATADMNGGRVIFRRDTGVMTYIQRNLWTITGDLRANPSEVTRALDAMLSLALVERGYLTLKASAVVRDGAGVALIGGPDSARRTLAVTLLGQGFQWVTEDLLLVRVVDGAVEMRGLPGLLRLSPAAMLAHPVLAATLDAGAHAAYAGQTWRELREHDTRYVVDASETFSTAGIAEGGILRAIVVLRWRNEADAGSPMVTDLHHADAAEALADATRSFGLYDLRGTLPPAYNRLQRLEEATTMRMVTGEIAPSTIADMLAHELRAALFEVR